VIVNPPGVDLNAWHPGELADGRPEPKRILFVGGDFKRKGGALLLDWFRHTEPGQAELHLVTPERVEATPGVYVYDNMTPNSEELRRLYQTADLFVLPSLGECFGLVTVEAMASGLPVIMSDVGGYADLVEHGGNGLVVPSGDTRELGEAIGTLLGSGARRVAMGNRSRQIAEERFNVETNADKMLSILKSSVENSKNPD
jgi:glycosyltransferase involved in cell wall biosynthesis